MARTKLKPFVGSLTKRLGRLVPKCVKDRSSEILIATGLLGWVTATILAVRATPKALANMENERIEQGVDKLSKKDIFNVTWRCYFLPVSTGILSSGLIIAGFSKTNKEKFKYALGYSMSETLLREYEQKMIDVVGKEKNDEIKEEIIEEQRQKNLASQKTSPAALNLNSYLLGDNVLCYDEAIGGYYFSTVNKLDSVKNVLNDQLNNSCMTVDLNEYKDALRDYIIPLPGFSLDHTETGAQVGWNTSYKIDISYDSMIYDGQIPCLYIRHVNPPIRDFDRTR